MSKKQPIPVEDNPGLVKDFNSGAVINTDSTAYRSAKAAKQKQREFLEMKAKLDEILSRLDHIEKQVDPFNPRINS
jgi:hypothetical protein